MIKGLDISHHNKNMKDPSAILDYDFIIMKASEGRGFRDPHLDKYMDILRSPENAKWPLIGFYHFARPDLGNSPEAEAEQFLISIRTYTRYKPLVALDVEGGALFWSDDLDEWCLSWCKHVYEHLGYKPLIYCSSSETRRFKKCTKWGCGLWVAKWGKKPTKQDIKPWEFWAIWQSTNSGICSAVRVDENYFNGTKEQFLKYCEVLNEEEKENNTATDSAAD